MYICISYLIAVLLYFVDTLVQWIPKTEVSVMFDWCCSVIEHIDAK